MAERIARENGSVFLVDRSEIVHEVAESLCELTCGAVGSATADLETFAGAQDAVAQAREAVGSLDVCINNVGGTIWAKPFEHYSEEEITKEINRSLFTTLWSVRAELPELIANGGGTIVNVSSVATRGVNRVPYAASKGGVNALTSALALEAAEKNVRVVATAPGGTRRSGPGRRAGKAVVPADRGSDYRFHCDGPLRHARRAGRADRVPRLQGGQLHHWFRPPRCGRRPRLA